MKQKKMFLVIALITSLIIPSGLIKAEVNQATINYLQNASQSAWITQALKAAGSNNLNLDYLADFEPANANDAAKAVLAIIAGGGNPYSYHGDNYVGGLLSYAQNNQIGSTSLINDDFWGILALRAAGEPVDSAIIVGSKNFILAAQNNDGGWSWAPDSESDTNDTAASIMALLEAGLNNDSQDIQQAINYLREAQNEDGGFPFSSGESDSGSDAWVIAALNKLGISPETWSVGNNNPIAHLGSLMLNDGSFKWLSSDNQGNLTMTAFAAVALAGKFFPVATYQPPADQNLHHLRIEGATSTICNAQVEGQTAQQVLENGAEICNYTYHIQTTDWGPYLDKINNDQAEGQNGWLYRVNWLSAQVGMANYNLAAGDEVLFYFAYWEDQPLRLSLSASQANPGDNITATVEYFNEQSWLPAVGTLVLVADREYQTNNQGQAIFSAPQDGSYVVYAQGDHKVRSPKQVLIVGQGSANGVVLNVDVANNAPVEQEEENAGALVFRVNVDHLDFGSLRPGGQLNRSLTITNQSADNMYLEGIVSGDALFENNVMLDDQIWENYNKTLARNEAVNIGVKLIVPQNYSNGHYSANLVLWGSAR
ncbi:MAG: DUF4430 domain-containing protein [Patescibacteria group bacterium]|jgi:hypothetical protein